MDKLDVQSSLSSLKSIVNKLGTNKLETTPVHLSKLSDVVNNDVVKKTEYDELVKTLTILKLLILVI